MAKKIIATLSVLTLIAGFNLNVYSAQINTEGEFAGITNYSSEESTIEGTLSVTHSATATGSITDQTQSQSAVHVRVNRPIWTVFVDGDEVIAPLMNVTNMNTNARVNVQLSHFRHINNVTNNDIDAALNLYLTRTIGGASIQQLVTGDGTSAVYNFANPASPLTLGLANAAGSAGNVQSFSFGGDLDRTVFSDPTGQTSHDMGFIFTAQA